MSVSIAATTNSLKFDQLKCQISNSALFEGPLEYRTPIFSASQNLTLKQQAENQALLDWNRCIKNYYIGSNSLFELREGKFFNSIDELYLFIKQSLLIGMSEDEHQEMLEQSIFHLHQGGILHSAGIALSNQFLRGSEYPTPVFSFKVVLYPMETGIGIEENLKLKHILTPDSLVYSAEDNDDLSLNVKHYGALERNPGFSNVAALSIHTDVQISEKVLTILDIKPNHSFDRLPLQLNPKTFSWLSYFTWPAELLFDSLAWQSSLSKEQHQAEVKWLTTFDIYLNHIKQKQQSAIKQLQHQQEKIDNLNTLKDTLASQIEKNNALLSPIKAGLANTTNQLEQFSDLLSNTSSDSHSQQQRAKFLVTLQAFQDSLTEHLSNLNQAIKLAEYLESPFYFRLKQLKQTVLNKKSKVSQLQRVVANPNISNTDEIISLSKALKLLLTDNEELQQAFSSIEERIAETSTKAESASLEFNSRIITTHKNLQEHNQELAAQLDALEDAITELKFKLKAIASQEEYVQYLKCRDKIFSLFRSIGDIDPCNLNSEQVTRSLADLLSAQDKVKNSLVKIKARIDIFNTVMLVKSSDYLEFISQYRNPLSIIERLSGCSKLKEQLAELKEQFVSEFKSATLAKLTRYSDPDGIVPFTKGWLFAGQWGKHHAARARTFSKSLGTCCTVEDTFLALEREKQYIETNFIKQDGEYCKLIADHLTIVKMVVNDDIIEQLAPNETALAL